MSRQWRAVRSLLCSFRLGALSVLCLAATTQAQPMAEPRDGKLTEAELELRKRLLPLVPSFRDALQGDNVEAQRATLAVIADIPPALAAGTNLSQIMTEFLQRDHRDAQIVALGLRSFGRSFPDAPDIAKVCEKHIRSKDVVIRRATAESLAAVIANSSVKSLAVAKPFVDVCQHALPLIGVCLEDSDPETQRFALSGLQSAARTVNDLYTFDRVSGFGEEVPKSLEERFAPLAPVVQGLATQIPKGRLPLVSPDANTRTAAARTLDSLAVLRRTIKNAHEVGSKDPFAASWPIVKPLLEARIKDESPAVRLAIVEALETLGDAVEARAIMRLAAADSSVYVRWAAARALGRSATAQATEKEFAQEVIALTKLVNDPDLDVRSAAIAALGKYGPAAKSAEQAVLEAAGRGDIEPRVAAVKTLGAIESGAAKTVPVLITGLENSDGRLRKAAAAGLVRFGPDAKAALPELRRALQSTDADLRLAAAEAILAIERKPRLKDL